MGRCRSVAAVAPVTRLPEPFHHEADDHDADDRPDEARGTEPESTDVNGRP
jgi:hypothetical protein